MNFPLFATILASLLFQTRLYADTEIANESFETSGNSFASRGGESLQVTDETAHTGTQSLKISNRTAVWNGPQYSISEPATYEVECYVSFNNPEYASHKFQLCWQNTLGGNTQYPTISEATCKNGEWAKLSGKFTVQDGMTGIAIYIQTAFTDNPTAKDLMDFYIDDFVCNKLEEQPYNLAELSDNTPLKRLYCHYFKIGTAVTAYELAMAKTKAMIDYHFNSITPGNELKPDAMLNITQCQTDNKVSVRLSADAKSILKYCSENHIPIRGHCLVWHSQTPAWFFREGFKPKGELLGKEAMTKRMEEYIKAVIETVTTSYPDLEIYAWDVVNEAFADGNGNLRTAGTNASNGQSLWTQIYGDQSFIDSAFAFARKYAPKGCKLYYNDFNEYIDSKRNAIYELVSRLYKNGTCDGIGMQSHLATNYPSIALYKSALDKFSKIGCDIQITELDMTIENGATEATQAKLYSDLFDLYIKYAEHISAVIFWGTQDGTSWRSSKNPLMFDADFVPKEAFYSIIDGLELPSEEEYREVDVETNAATPDIVIYGANGRIVANTHTAQKKRIAIYRIDGHPVGQFNVDGYTEIYVPAGIYIANNQKIMVW